MNAIALNLALAVERLIQGSALRLDCNCSFEVLCTMPITFWVRTKKYVHHCPRHPKKRGRSVVAARHEPFWFDTAGHLLEPNEFSETFRRLAAEGAITLVPGYVTNQGRTKLPSLLSMEGTHYIIETGQTEVIPRE